MTRTEVGCKLALIAHHMRTCMLDTLLGSTDMRTQCEHIMHH